MVGEADKNKINGSLQPQTLEVKELDTEKEFQGTKKELLIQLVELVGLTYEQFTRTVLLAQNDFATFLKSKWGGKSRITGEVDRNRRVFPDFSRGLCPE